MDYAFGSNIKPELLSIKVRWLQDGHYFEATSNRGEGEELGSGICSICLIIHFINDFDGAEDFQYSNYTFIVRF